MNKENLFTKTNMNHCQAVDYGVCKCENNIDKKCSNLTNICTQFPTNVQSQEPWSQSVHWAENNCTETSNFSIFNKSKVAKLHNFAMQSML